MNNGNVLRKAIATLILLLCLSAWWNTYSLGAEGSKEVLTDTYLLELIKKAPEPVNLPGIPAVYLLMAERDWVNEDGTATYEIHMVYKILDNQAIPLGEVSVPFNSTNSTLDVDLARTIKPDTTVINVEPEDVREVSPYSGFPFYTNVKLKQFSMPAVEIGSIIEYKCTLRLFKPEMPGLIWSYWAFPPGLPVMLSTFEVNIPEGVEGKYVARNLDIKPKVSVKEGRKIYRWAARDIMIEGTFEPFLPPYENACPNLTFATAKEWGEMATWFYGISEPQMAPNPEMKDFVERMKNRKGGDPLKVMEGLYNFVSQDIRYVAIPLKTSNYQPHKVTDVYMNRYGDCKDKSALLISLYRLAGVDAYFALLKPRSEGLLVREFPALDFTHCIVAVPKKEGGYLFLDPTLELNRFGYVLTGMRDTDILVVKKGGYEFVKLPLESEHVTKASVDIKMDIGEDYAIDISEKNTLSGEAEIGMRLNAKYSTPEATRAFFEQAIQSLFAKAKLVNVDFSDPDDLGEPFWLTCNYEVRNHIKEAGNLLILDLPMNTAYSRMSISTEKRIHPLWFPDFNENITTFDITLPPNCKINYIPPKIEKDTAFGHYKRDVTSGGGKIKVAHYFKAKMLEIPPELYKEYKEFTEFTIKASEESIILEKK